MCDNCTFDKNTIVIGVIGADCHAVGNRILEEFFTKKGFHVVNLGVMNSQEEFVDAAEENQAGAIMVSSLYGHGEIDCRGLREKCNHRGLTDIVLYIGGNLTVGSQPFSETEKAYKNMGFDRAFSAESDLEECASLLRSDLCAKVGVN